MSKYLVTVREIYENTYLIEADSSKEAEEICKEGSYGCNYSDLIERKYYSSEFVDINKRMKAEF